MERKSRMETCNRLTGLERREGFWLLHTDAADLKLVFLTEEIVRIRVSFDRRFPEASYVLALTAWEDRLDALLGPERERVAPRMPDPEEADGGRLVFRTGSLSLEFTGEPFSARLLDGDGAELWASLPGRSFQRDTNRRVRAYSRMEEDDCFFGFGEQTGLLNKSMRSLREKAADAMGYDPERAETLYKHIPFGIRLSRKTGKAVGLFFHNFQESRFDLGTEKSNYWPRYWSFTADGGDIDLFLLGGGSLKSVLNHYTRLTGRPALLPKRALGYQASSMFYPELARDCDRAVLDFVAAAREEGFPLDGFHLSSGYTVVKQQHAPAGDDGADAAPEENPDPTPARNADRAAGKRCVFTWNRERFPAPDAFFSHMNEAGAPVAPNVKPGVLLCHPRFEEFWAEGAFLQAESPAGEGTAAPHAEVPGAEPDAKKPGGADPAVAPWWGGPGAFWDFTDPAARLAWKTHLKEDVLSFGTDSVWNDNCEYDSVLDGEARASFDGEGAPIEALRPLMSNLMCRAAAEAVKELHPNARPYVVCRSGAAGIQRYAQTWCGDNRTGWDSLRFGIPLLLGMGLSGQPNEGADIGGFAGPAPDEELFLRWVQNGVFQPRFSIHSASSDNTVTEPWMYGGAKEAVRQAMLLRYRLLPYLYSAVYEASRTGAPVMRPLVYEFQEDIQARDESFEFLFGRDLLVANVLEPGATERRVYLPAGCRWYDLNDRCRPYEGGQTVAVPVTEETIPLFLREGAILPLAGNQPMNMERDPVTLLRLILAPGREAREYTLYDDDGASNDYLHGEFRKTRIAVALSDTETATVSFAAEGSYPDPVERVSVEMLHPEGSPFRVSLEGGELPQFLNRRRFEAADRGWYYSQTRRAVLIRYPNPRRDANLEVCFQRHDLIGMGRNER